MNAQTSVGHVLTEVSSGPYRRNLEALAALQPTVAAAVEAADVPEGVAPATGRDGKDTFLLPGKDGRSVWLGGSSMPSISAPEILAGFRGDGRSAILPGVGTGMEPLVALSRMPPPTALFVLERSPLFLKLALHLHDYEAELKAGRLVFILGDPEELIESFRHFFERHCGYELPARLIPVPQLPAAAIHELQGWLERAGQAVTADQTQVVNTLVERIRGLGAATVPESPRVAVLSVDSQPVVLEQARRVERALTQLGWAHRLCIPDAASRCHVSERLRAIADLAAELVLFVGTGASTLRPLLPEGFPIASWYLPGAAILAPPKGFGGHETIFAACESIRQALVAVGADAAVIEWSEPAADDTIYHPEVTAEEPAETSRMDVAVLADLPDDRPASCDVTLASHLALWRKLQSVVKRQVGRYRASGADELLDEAQQQSGTTLQDAQVRRHFLELLRTRIAPAAVARVAAETLLAKRYRIGLWGHNWPALKGKEDVRKGSIPTGRALNRIFNTAGVVVLPDASPRAAQTALDALAAGARVVCRCPDRLVAREHPRLAELVPHFHLYRTSGELLEAVRASVPAGVEPERRPDAGRRLVLARHTTTHRLVTMVETIRKRRAAGAALEEARP